MIHSSTIDGHHFLVARRRGYDRSEVDAVINRLVATLRKYEERDAEFAGSRLADGVEVTDLDSVRAARDEVLQNAEAVGHQLELEARTRLEEAERLTAEQLQTAREEAAQIVELARADAGKLLSRRNARAETLITAALSEVKALRARVFQETNEFRSGKKTEASGIVRAADLQADQLLEDARHEAGSILGRARREHTLLEQRIGQLRSAIAGIEGQFRNLAESTLEQTEIMSTMSSLETGNREEVLGDATDEPGVVRLTQQGLTVDLTEEDPGEPPPSPPSADRYVVPPGDTIYQRHGTGLGGRLTEEDPDEPNE